MFRRASAAIITTLAFCVINSPASAQETDWSDAGSASSQRFIEERNRESMRFTEAPLTIVGIEQGDNDFRSDTPSLLNTTGRVAMVDTEEAYQRKLAMFSEGAIYGSPVRVDSMSFARSNRNRNRPVSASQPEAAPELVPEPEESSSQRWLWVAPIGLFLLIVGFFARRNR